MARLAGEGLDEPQPWPRPSRLPDSPTPDPRSQPSASRAAAGLVSQGERPGVDWAVATPPQAAYVHLVNMWRCFGQDHCYTKHNKRWWLRANGLWDSRLDAPPATPRHEYPRREKSASDSLLQNRPRSLRVRACLQTKT